MSNKGIFKSVREGDLTLSALFEDMFKRHSPEDTARVLTAGTPITTPNEADMLVGWQKPFLFARFFLGYLGFLLIAFLMASLLGFFESYYLLLVGIPFLVPVTLLLLVLEMNVPRNISLYEVITITAIGGVLSLLATMIGNYYSGGFGATWAGLIEEPAKLIVIYIFLRRKNYKYTLNGIVVGAAVGTGFAIMESLLYVIDGIAQGVLLGLQVDTSGNFNAVWVMGIQTSLYIAVARAVTAISGHGIFAALYGGALVKAKGEDTLQLNHLFKPDFLLYFAAAILLHALHNSGIDLGLPALLNGLLPFEYIILAFAALALLLHALRTGVNQVVQITTAPYQGRVTCAVARAVLQCTAGPLKGQSFFCEEGQSLTMGRMPGNDIALTNSKNISSSHCIIRVTDGHVMVTDMNSMNGTYLDGRKLTPNRSCAARDGAVLTLANDEYASECPRPAPVSRL